MQIKREDITPTSVKLTITADQALMDETKQHVLKHLAQKMKLSGFRPGKAPLPIVEKNADPSVLQTEFLDEILNQLYGKAIDSESLRPVGQPKVSLQKFVPFTDLEITVEVEVIGAVKLPDYKKLKVSKKLAEVTDKDVTDVIDNLRVRLAERRYADRPAKGSDEVMIDFTGTDSKTKEAIKGADGKNYPLVLGSDSFIPGFESNVVGMQSGETKSFALTFPKDYGVKALQNRKVSFEVTVQAVKELVKPKIDDAFATKSGPFKTLKDLKADIRKQLLQEKQGEADRDFENRLLEQLADKTTVALPESLVTEELERTIQQVKQNLAYRGQAWDEYLADMGQSEDEYRDSLRAPAERRVKVSLALSEIAEQEGITVTPEEFQLRMQLLKGQYASDKLMQAELDKPENARSVISNMLTEKTLAKLTDFAVKA